MFSAIATFTFRFTDLCHPVGLIYFTAPPYLVRGIDTVIRSSICLFVPLSLTLKYSGQRG